MACLITTSYMADPSVGRNCLSCHFLFNLFPRRDEPLLYMTEQYSHQSSHLQLSIRHQTLNRQDNPMDWGWKRAIHDSQRLLLIPRTHSSTFNIGCSTAPQHWNFLNRKIIRRLISRYSADGNVESTCFEVSNPCNQTQRAGANADVRSASRCRIYLCYSAEGQLQGWNVHDESSFRLGVHLTDLLSSGFNQISK